LQTTCPAFEFLDPKDALYRCLSACQANAVMPPTQLIAYDCDHESDLPELSLTTTSTSPLQLLKAPLGSGGDALYYITSKSDVLSIIRAHRTKAENTPGFLDSLRADYNGSVPSWSLQTIIPSAMLANQRKCQVRAYVIYCDSELYLYTDYEVRQPMWIKLQEQETGGKDTISPTLQADLDFCANCTDGAKPYNFQRSKTHTERMMISEVEGRLGEISTIEKITHVMLTAFRALKPQILAESFHSRVADRELLQPIARSTYHQQISEMAIIGADLIVADSSMQPYIVEINNNPAMPAPTKTMTEQYQSHLVEFVASLVTLGLETADTNAIKADKSPAMISVDKRRSSRKQHLKKFLLIE
jgi:hypothetical protein